MNILITTPSGAIGRRILPELLAPEFSVRVITRHPDQLPGDIREQVEVVQGSTDNAGILCEALDGVDALLWCSPGETLHESNFRSRHERFARAASQAIRRNQTPRVVNISATGQLPARSSDPGWSATEEILNKSGAAIRHLRCSWPEQLSQLSSTHNQVPIAADARISRLAANIADIALRLLVRRDWSGIQALSVGYLAESGYCGAYSDDPEIFEKSPDIALSVV